MKKLLNSTFLFLVLSISLIQSSLSQDKKPELLLRVDDIGMNHSVNAALKELAQTGIPFSTSVMFACPWYQEAVDILKGHPQIAVGVHLTLNSEWKYYRWGLFWEKKRYPA